MPAWWAAWIARASVTTSSAACASRLGGSRQAVAQVPSLQQFQRAVREDLGPVRIATGLAGLIDLDDIVVVQPGDCLGLGFEAGEMFGESPATGLDHLQGDLAAQLPVEGPVNDTHSAPTQFTQDFVAPDGRPSESLHALSASSPRVR